MGFQIDTFRSSHMCSSRNKELDSLCQSSLILYYPSLLDAFISKRTPVVHQPDNNTLIEKLKNERFY